MDFLRERGVNSSCVLVGALKMLATGFLSSQALFGQGSREVTDFQDRILHPGPLVSEVRGSGVVVTAPTTSESPGL